MAKGMSEQWIGKEVIMDMHTFLDVAEQKAAKAHTLLEHLENWDNLFGWVDAEVEDQAVIDMASEVNGLLFMLRTGIESSEAEGLALMAETTANMHALDEAVKHRDYRAVRQLQGEVDQEEAQLERLTKEEIKAIHGCFVAIMRVVKASGLLDREITDKRLSTTVQSIYMMLGTYERIFRDLWHKERELEKVFKQD